MMFAQVVARFGEFVIVRPTAIAQWRPGDWLRCAKTRPSIIRRRRCRPSNSMLDQLLDEANRAVADAHAAVVRNFGD
jgi:hypothetical protein